MNYLSNGMTDVWISHPNRLTGDGSILSEFDRIVAAAPESVALEMGTADGAVPVTMTYAELAARSAGLAHRLMEADIGAGDRVGLATDRSFDVVVGMLGILRAGAAYVPLDRSSPKVRLEHLIADAALRAVAVSGGPEAFPLPVDVPTIVVDGPALPPSGVAPAIGGESPAYVIYTSGSTGRPKGVVTPHRAVLRLVRDADYVRFGPDRRVLQLASVAFDAATFEIWGALLNGGTCVIYPDTGLPDPARLRAVLARMRITTLWLTSGLFNSLIDTDPAILSGVEDLMIGGEALSVGHVRKGLAALPARIVNGYGPTETTTFACTWPIPRDLPADTAFIPIGRPIGDTAVSIRDEDGAPVAAGGEGELYIAGAGLALGYLDRPELTAEKFVAMRGAPGGRAYRTGDIVRMRGDGALEFVGRRDGQVKVAGHRIELGEIEAVFRDHLGVRDAAAAVFRQAGGPDRIALWIVAAQAEMPPADSDLAAFAAERLATYMRPAAYRRIDALPLTSSGKLDRARLEVTRLERPALAQPFEPPRGVTEAWIAATWVDLIGVDRVGRRDRFFELGGTSLMVMRFLDLLHRERGVRIGVADFFDGPTVEALARLAGGRSEATPVPARPVRAGTGDARIAIVGMAGRFAGAPDLDAFWDMLSEGRSGRVEITADDMLAAGEDPALLAEPDYVAAAFPLDEAGDFDAAFFGLTPREVQLMDPQQRIFLEAAWSALEDAGCDPRGTQDRIGVFGGVGRNAYLLHNLMSHPDLRASAAEYNMLIGNERDFPSAHVAFRLGLRGPAITVQTACSTSGVAIHMAAESLRRMECDMALAGGAKVLVPNRVGYRHVEGGPLSTDGFIRAFDAGASGMVRGSGVAMIALKRLDDALRDGDHVRAVLIGSAINNDGDQRAGFTAPSVSGQADVIAEAHRRAGIDAGSVSLIEAHGTGTPLGDPIEVTALTRAFAQPPEAAATCAIGSVKTNIGHLDAGATAAGVIKAVLSLENGRIPPSLNYVSPNPGLGLETSPFRVNDRLSDWPRGDRPRRAGISSFGLGGTNAHILIEEAPETGEGRDSVAGPHLFVLSARTDTALARRCADLARWLERHPDADLADVAHSLRVGRRRFERRLAFLAHDRAEAIAKLRAHPDRPEDMLRASLAADSAPVLFAFPGTGTQYRGMARGLYASEPVFAAALDECSELYEALEGVSLVGAIFGDDADLERTSRAMPAIFAVEVALGRLLEGWGVSPEGMIGHSLGEYSAACLAGVFSLPDAMAAVHRRATLLETLPEGAMIGVPLPEADLRGRLGPDVDIAAINGPDRCVVSGRPEAIAALAEALEADGVASRRLETRVALHSAMVDPILTDFRDFVAALTLNAPARPFVSCVTGGWITAEEATDPGYWARHLRQPVRFADGLATLLAQGGGVFLEVGPGQTLGTFARQHPARSSGLEVLACLRHPKTEADDREVLLGTVGRLWLAGAGLDAAALVAGRDVRRIPLPTYPFERKRHWIEAIPYGPSADTTGEGPVTPQAAGASATAKAPEELAVAAVPRTRPEQILDALRAIIHDLSGIPVAELDAHATFLELGFDSLFLTQANAAIRKVFGVRLTARQLLETTPGLQLLAQHLDTILGPDLPAAVATRTDSAVVASSAPAAAPPRAAASPGIAEVVRKGADDLTPGQQAHIDTLIAETVRRTPEAKRRTQETRAVLADPRTVQGFRSQWKEMVYPILSDRAKGSKVWDIDGNEYVDLVGGYGVTMLGHQPDFLVKALRDQIDRTMAIGPQTVLAGEVARLVHEMTGMERVAFCNTGSEAVLAAVRMARTVTGRSRIVKFDGHYHGIFDEMQVRGSGSGDRRVTLPSAPGIPAEAVQNTIVLDYGSEDVFDYLRAHAGEIACVLVEPIRSRNPDYQPVEYLRKLRAVTEEVGIPLLIDEIVTGFRSHPGGIQALYGIRADLVTYGKVVGSGLPIGIVTGSALYMDALDGGMWNFGDASVPPADMTWFAGTFVRHPLSLAAAKATLDHLRAEGPGLQAGLNDRSAALVRRLNASFEALSVPIRVEQFASLLMVTFTRHQEYASLLFFHLRNRGVMTYEGRPIFLSTAHDDADFDKVHDAFVGSAKALISVGLLEGRNPEGRRRIPMSIGQQEIWIFAQFDPQANCSYNLCSTLRLGGALDDDALEAALRDLCDRHEALRALPERDGLMQVVRERIDVGLDRQEVPGLDADGIAEVIERVGHEEVTTPFDLDRGPLIRARLVRFGPRDHLMLLTVHHVIADGWSCGILLRELGALYAARRAGIPADLPPAQQLGDFVAMQRDAGQGDMRQEARDYWVGLYPDGLSRIDFPADRPRPKTRSYAARRFEIMLDRDFVAGLRRVAKDNGTTLFATLIGGFAAYVARLTGVRDNTIGFSAAGQPLLGGKSLVGHCVSFLPLKLSTDLELGFSRHLRGIGASVLDALEHQNFDFVSFVQETSPKRDADWAPLVSIGVNLDPSAKGVGFGDLDVATGSVGRVYENLDLFLNFAEIGPDMELQCTFNTALFDLETIERRMREYLRLLARGMDSPGTPIGTLDIVAAEDLAESPARMPEGRYDREGGVVAYFREMTALRAEATALRVVHPAGGEEMSYAGLDRRSDAIAHALQARGVAAGDRVAVVMPRSCGLVAALLGILKVGAVYVPIDVSTPRERIRAVLADCGAGLVLASRDAEGLEASGVLRLEDVAQELAAPFLAVATGGGDPAYIMYTSGSTGVPKGVVVPHRAIARLVVDGGYVRLDATRTVPFLSPPAFDASTFEIWGALLNGGTLSVIEGSGVPELDALRRALQGATTMWLTSALFNAIVDQDPTVLQGLDDLLVGGQALSVQHVRRAQSALPGLRIFNGYGPTENTTFTCVHAIPHGFAGDAGSVPIGRPIAGTSLAIVDALGRSLPRGVPGELVTGGDGLALGYWNRPDLTATSFGEEAGADGRRYRTGDVCRMTEDGTVEFLHRRDAQVKIRGFRIEPQEVEVALESLSDVRSAAVIAVGPAQDTRLVAFVVPGEARTTAASITARLRDVLPRHLIPSEVKLLEVLPVTSNGKVDHKALALQAAAPAGRAPDVPPATATERRLLKIWSEILRIPVTSVEHDFFDLGGHSLNALRLFDSVARDFGADLPMSSLFAHPTIRNLGDVIDGRVAESAAIDPDAPWDNSIVIHPGPGGSTRPIFIAGGVGGNVNNLSDMGASLGRHRPVIGFQARGVMGHYPLGTIEEIAAENIYYMRRHQIVGPYILAGYSAGAFAAFEMARQLTAAGHAVEELIILDTYAPGFRDEVQLDTFQSDYASTSLHGRLAREIREFRRNGGKHFGRRAQGFAIRSLARSRFVRRLVKGNPWFLSSQRSLHAWYNELHEHSGEEPLSARSGNFHRSIQTTEAWFEASNRYAGGPYAGKASLVLSAPTGLWEKELTRTYPDLGWHRFFDPSRLHIHRTVADHIGMVQGADGTALAEFIASRVGKRPG